MCRSSWASQACLICCASGEGLCVNHSLSAVGMPRIAAGPEFSCRLAKPGPRLALGPGFHGGPEVWRWYVKEGVGARLETLSAPMYHLLERPPRRNLFRT